MSAEDAALELSERKLLAADEYQAKTAAALTQQAKLNARRWMAAVVCAVVGVLGLEVAATAMAEEAMATVVEATVIAVTMVRGVATVMATQAGPT